MTQQRQNKMVGTNNMASKFGDTTWTKIFVGGLAWETQSDTMNLYFQQFGEILEAVVIADKITGKSKGYGFVTFKNPDSAVKACQDPYPVIDGRRANCNLASLGATHKNRHSPSHAPPQQGMEQFRPPHVPRSAVHHGGSMYYHQPVPHNTFAYPAYGYPSYAQDMYAMNYYNNAYSGQHYPFYYAPGVYYGYRPSYGQTSPRQHPKLAQNPYLPQQYHASSPTLASPPLITGATTDESGTATIAADSEQKSSD